MNAVAAGLNLLQALAKAGFPLPPETRSAALLMDVNDAVVLRIEVLVTKDDLILISDAMRTVVKEMK